MFCELDCQCTPGLHECSAGCAAAAAAGWGPCQASRAPPWLSGQKLPAEGPGQGRAPADGDVCVLDALHDCDAVPLHGLRVYAHHLGQCVERHVAQVVVLVAQEPAAPDSLLARRTDEPMALLGAAASARRACPQLEAHSCPSHRRHPRPAQRRHLPRMLMASTRRPPMASTLTDMMVCTHSYWMALPALRRLSAEVATCASAARPQHVVAQASSQCGASSSVQLHLHAHTPVVDRSGSCRQLACRAAAHA